MYFGTQQGKGNNCALDERFCVCGERKFALEVEGFVLVGSHQVKCGNVCKVVRFPAPHKHALPFAIVWVPLFPNGTPTHLANAHAFVSA